MFPFNQNNFKFYPKTLAYKWHKKSLNQKTQLYFKFLKEKTIASQEIYKTYRNKFTSVVQKAKKEYYSQIFAKYRTNIRSIWDTINSIIKQQTSNTLASSFLQNGKELDCPVQIANAFNKYFANVGSSIAASTTPTTIKYTSYLYPNQQKSLFLLPVTEIELENIIKGMQNKNSTDIFGHSMRLLKQCFTFIASPLANLFNTSFVTGTFPHIFKTAKIKPLFKKVTNLLFQITDLLPFFLN